MNMVSIAFDTDGVIKDINSPDNAIKCNERIRTLVVTLASFKNVEIIAWSKRGAVWAQQVCVSAGLEPYVNRYLLKEPGAPIDIAIDDEHATTLGTVNLITNELGHKAKAEWFS